MHPDHVGGAEAASEATGAPVFQGRLDYEQGKYSEALDAYQEVPETSPVFYEALYETAKYMLYHNPPRPHAPMEVGRE